MFLPLFHRPRFYETFVANQNSDKYSHLTRDSALTLNCLISLSARFSTSPYFNGVAPQERGTPFARQAQALYEEATRFSEIQAPTLQYLQGCILLAYQNQASGPTSGGWLLVGTCARLAYDLGLNKIDEDSLSDPPPTPQWTSVEHWSWKEERRRAWWSVWELDAFASVISRRPFTLDRNRIHVFLPVSDDAWFAGEPVASAMINPEILHCWESLQDSPNQDERAWFLLGNYIMVQAHDLGQQRSINPKLVKDIESAVTCFSLLLPEKFHVGSGYLLFDRGYQKSNWIILTQLFVQA